MDEVLEPLIKRAAKRRKLKRVAAVAGGLAAAGVVAGGVAWSRKHPRDPKGRFRDTPDMVQAKQPGLAGSKDLMVQANRRAMRRVQGAGAESLSPKLEIDWRNGEYVYEDLDKNGKTAVPAVETWGKKGFLPSISDQDFKKLYPHLELHAGNSRFKPWSNNNRDKVQRAFHHFAQQFPETAKRVEFISEDSRMPFGGMAVSAVDRDGRSRFGVFLNLNGDNNFPWDRAYIIDKHLIPGNALDQLNLGASPVEQLVLHELGHVLKEHAELGALGGPKHIDYLRAQGARFAQDFGWFNERRRHDPSIDGDARLVRELRRTRNEIELSSLRDAYEEAHGNRGRNVISRYAMSNPEEYWAENFASYMTFLAPPHDDVANHRIDPNMPDWMRWMADNVKAYEQHYAQRLANGGSKQAPVRHGPPPPPPRRY